MGVFDFLSGLAGGDGADGAEQSGGSTDADSEPEGTNRPADATPADFRERAESLTRRSDVPTLDFTVESLHRLDDLAAGPKSAVDDEFAYGSYLGETIVRRFGGEWYADDDWQVAVDLPEDETTIAVFDAAAMSIAREPVFAEVVAHLEAQGADRESVSADAEEEKPAEDEPAEGEVTEDQSIEDEPTAAEDESGATESVGPVDETPPPADVTPDGAAPEVDLSSDEVSSAEDVASDEETPVEDVVPEDGVAADSDQPTDDTDVADEAGETETVIVEEPDDGAARDTDALDKDRDTDAPDVAGTIDEDRDTDATDAVSDTDEDAGIHSTDESQADIHDDTVPDERDGDYGHEDDTTESDDRDEFEVAPDRDQSIDADSSDESAVATDERSIDGRSDTGQWESQTGIGPADDTPDAPSDRYILRTAVDTLADDWPERNLDVTPDSLSRLDAFVDDKWDGRFRASSLAERTVDYEDSDDPLTQLGAYYGEVLVRHLDGEWVDTEDGEGVVAVPDADGRTERVRVFDVARECLTEPSAFAYWYDALLNQLDLDEPAVSDGRREVYDADADSLASGDVITQFATAADEFVTQWPDYPFDYSPRSLRYLDDLATNAYSDRDFSGVPLADGTDPDSLQLTAAATEIGAYFAAVLLRHRDAQVRIGDAPELVIDTAGKETTVDPVATAAACLRDERSFTEAYAQGSD